MSESTAPTLRVATYNVRGCKGIDRRRSEKRIAEVIASLPADLVGLQELDLARKRSAGVDQAGLIANELGWHALFQAAVRIADEQYGDAIVSRYPLRLQRVLPLPGQGSWYCRETRIALWAEADTPLGPVQIVNTHFGLGRTERFLQAQFMVDAEQLGAVPASIPLVLLGDFNSLPGSRTHRCLAGNLRDVRALLPSAGPCRTFPTRFPRVAVDHIFVNTALSPVALAVHRTPLARAASDHYPLVAELSLNHSVNAVVDGRQEGTP